MGIVVYSLLWDTAGFKPSTVGLRNGVTMLVAMRASGFMFRTSLRLQGFRFTESRLARPPKSETGLAAVPRVQCYTVDGINPALRILRNMP